MHSSDSNMVSEVRRLAREVLGVEPGMTTRGDHTTTVWSWKRQVTEFFKGYGYPEGKKSGTVVVPEAVLLGALEIKKGFLKGLFSADGCFYREGLRGECRIEVASIGLGDGFVQLASELGFEFRKYTYIHHGGNNKLPLHLAYLGRQAEAMRWMN